MAEVCGRATFIPSFPSLASIFFPALPANLLFSLVSNANAFLPWRSVPSSSLSARYAWVGEIPGTDRGPNGGFYQITSLSAIAPNQFDDPEGTVVVLTS